MAQRSKPKTQIRSISQKVRAPRFCATNLNLSSESVINVSNRTGGGTNFVVALDAPGIYIISSEEIQGEGSGSLL